MMTLLQKFTALLLLAGVSCSTQMAGTGGDRDFERSQKMEEESKARFRAEYAKYEIDQTPHDWLQPSIRLESFRQKQSLISAYGLELELELGDRWSVAPNAIYRSESRYRLRDTKGAVVASAESVFATQDLKGEKVGEWIVAMADHKGRAFFIGEKHNWSTQRYIVIQQVLDEGGQPGAWSVNYVNAPHRENGFSPFSIDADLLGVHEDKLIFKMDDQLYAMPLDKLGEVESLAYSIG